MKKLKNKVVLITGSSSGIGEATAKLFSRLGAKVVVNSKSNVSGGKKVVSEIIKDGGKAVYIQANISEPEEVKTLFKKIVDEFGTLDILINNAGVARGKEFLKTTKEDWIQEFNDNFFGTVLCSQQAVRIMKQGDGGKILNTASIRGLDSTGREGIMPYSTAKAAVVNFTKTLAKEVAPKIQVNAVAPGFVYTPNYDSMPDEVKDKFIENTYLKRWINVDEIAEAFAYLAQAEAVTGEVLVVDAGFTLKDG